MENYLIGNPRQTKPASNDEYGAVRWEILAKGPITLSDNEFINLVTNHGCPFYGALVRDGYDGTQSFTTMWKKQTLVGVDFDDCTIPWKDMVLHYKRVGLCPWFAYETFSGPGNYRLIFKVDPSDNGTQEDWAHTIKVMAHIGGTSSDKKSGGSLRMWQGSLSGTLYCARTGKETLLRSNMFNFESKAIR